MSNILVTGGAGFIGHNVVRILEKDHTVHILDNLTNYGFIPAAEMQYLTSERKKMFMSGMSLSDIRTQSSVLLEFALDPYIDTVVHLASFPRQKVVAQNPAEASEVMITGLINLLEAAASHKVRKFVYISSSMVYGDFTSGVTEDSACSPQGQYAIMKYAGEKIVEDYARRTGIEFVIIRPSAVYGERDVEDRVISKFLLTAMRGKVLKVSGPDEVLDFTYVDDTARGIAIAAIDDDANGQIFNITRSSNTQTTLLQAAKLIVGIVGSGEIQIGSRDASFPSRGHLSIEKAKRLLGYHPTVNVDDGLQRYYEWLKVSDYWQKNI